MQRKLRSELSIHVGVVFLVRTLPFNLSLYIKINMSWNSTFAKSGPYCLDGLSPEISLQLPRRKILQLVYDIVVGTRGETAYMSSTRSVHFQ